MTICLGTPITAPDGWDQIAQGQTVYFLRSREQTVHLVHFFERPSRKVKSKTPNKKPKTIAPPVLTRLIRVQREFFERGVTRGELIAGECQVMPPWLGDLRPEQLTWRDSEQRAAKLSHGERIDRKLAFIYPLVRDLDALLQHEDPDRVINRHARKGCSPRQNETRLRQWTYAYLVFGLNRFALHYPVHRIGHWDRYTDSSGAKRGRPHRKGRNYGHNTSKSMREAIVRAYRAEGGLGISMSDIYSRAMTKHFGARVQWVTDGVTRRKAFVHPAGEPLPTKKTFVYHVLNQQGRRAVQRTMFGRVIARSAFDVTRGSFGEHSWNLMQRVEHDAYSVKELPKGYVEGSTLPALKVTRSRDTVSGMITGIGFSSGGEDAGSYRMAKFCAAIPKRRFCALFGVDIEEEQWPSIGLAPHDIQDRGPGATPGAESRGESGRPVIFELPPAYSGQSKAIVETSNPKTWHDREAPKHVKSDLTTIELARREIYRLLADNERVDMSARVSPELLPKLSRLSPNGVWEALSSLGRNSSVQISFDQAVRSFLDTAKARLDRDGVTLLGRNYYSPELERVGAMNGLTGGRGLDVKVYYLEACVRHIWLDIRGRLVELDVRYAMPVGAAVEYMSLDEVKEYSQVLRSRKADHEEHALAVTADFEQLFYEQTGKAWRAGRVVAGRANRGTAIAKGEAQEARSVGGRRAAA